MLLTLTTGCTKDYWNGEVIILINLRMGIEGVVRKDTSFNLQKLTLLLKGKRNNYRKKKQTKGEKTSCTSNVGYQAIQLIPIERILGQGENAFIVQFYKGLKDSVKDKLIYYNKYNSI